ncbi:cyclophilin-like fold protein [Serratia sp. L9]|uniref:cyclophilin-like fold protein n=1 Tax=Serratia sp. L9 TaxID=3423946 RepID=UPI003D66A618
MKKPLSLLFLLVTYAVFPVHANDVALSGQESPMIIKMTLHQQNYAVELADNPTAKEFMKQLPLALTMQELNGNEKFAELSHALPIHPIGPETIHKGDLMLYGRQTLVLFYETFRTSYRYTPIGKVVAPDTLQDAVGRSSIQVNLSMMK